MTEKPNRIPCTDFNLVDFVQYFIDNRLTISERVQADLGEDPPGDRATPVENPVAKDIANRIQNKYCAHHFPFPKQPGTPLIDGIRVIRKNGNFLFERWILQPNVLAGGLTQNQIDLIERFRKPKEDS